MIHPWVNFVVALPAEAKPIASYFELRRTTPDSGFPLYRGERISLVISGSGKVAAAAAVGWLAAHTQGRTNTIWINVGIAGHRERPLGDAVMAHTIVDRAAERTWYPPLAIQPPVDSITVKTLDQPATEYPTDEAFEMEASGFYSSACRFSTGELVHCFKVISDNRQNPVHGINARLVYQWIGEHLDTLSLLIGRLGALAEPLYASELPPELLDHYRHHWRFSSTQQNQLRQILTRWRTLAQSDLLWLPELRKLPDAKAVIAYLKEYVGALPVKLVRS